MNPFIRLCHATHTGANRISHAIQGAHEGSVFAVCMLRNGTLVSGGKDRRLLSWDGSYRQLQAVEVRGCFFTKTSPEHLPSFWLRLREVGLT